MTYTSKIFNKLKKNSSQKTEKTPSYASKIFKKIKTTNVKIEATNQGQFKYNVGYFVSNETKEEFLKIIDFFTADPELKLFVFFDDVDFDNQEKNQLQNNQIEYKYNYKNESSTTLLKNIDLVIALECDDYSHELIKESVEQNIFCVSLYSEKLNTIIMKDDHKVLSVVHNFPEFYGYIDYVISKVKVFKNSETNSK